MKEKWNNSLKNRRIEMRDEIPANMCDNAENYFVREFRLFFALLRVFGIEMPDHSFLNKQTLKAKEKELIWSFNASPAYVFIVIFYLVTMNSILWIIILPRGSKEITNTFLTLLKILSYILIIKKRRTIVRIIDKFNKLRNALGPQYNFRLEKRIYTVYFLFVLILFAVWSIMFSLTASRRQEFSKVFFREIKFPPQLCTFCAVVLLMSDCLFHFIIRLSFSVFVIYYSLICRVIRLLFGCLIDRFHRQIWIKEHRSLLVSYGEITKSIRNIDREFSFAIFAIIIVNMVELFWGGYRLAFRSRRNTKYVIALICSASCYLTFQLLIMISACMTNEMAEKVKNTLLCMKYRFSRDLRETKFKEVSTKENNLTLWKMYFLDRSLLITSFGTVLTYGILIGTLGDES
ncbi:uncharacterized protein TNCT_36921 [Trichonephila clavata]|uniref:Uncharacterized protein n=1 Tax=Trichonephila clavata TaxID=2740835 RepID=A0A8X6LP11_TRICU|nr:uncharacterized protein TNCT_36921 [Trichonephila clavata]